MSSRQASISKKSTIIIQYFLAFCDPTEEFFQNIRLVSKPWKYAIETMKYEELPNPFFWENLHTHGGKFPPFLKKYLQMFQQLDIRIPNWEPAKKVNFFEHWDSLRLLILNNLKNLSHIEIREIIEGLEKYEPIHYPQNFKGFLCTLIENSKNTLKVLLTSYNFLPPFPLPNVEKYGVSTEYGPSTTLLRPYDELPWSARLVERIEGLGTLYGDFFENEIYRAKNLFPELNTILLNEGDLGIRYDQNGLNDPIIKVMTQNYKKHLYIADSPVWDEYFVPPKVSRFQNPPRNFSMLFDLEIMVIDLPEDILQINPLSRGWDRFESFMKACTKLEIVVFHNFTEKDFGSVNFPNVNEEAKIIWKQRFLLLKSRGVTLYFEDNHNQFYEIDYKKFEAEHDIDWKFEFSSI